MIKNAERVLSALPIIVTLPHSQDYAIVVPKIVIVLMPNIVHWRLESVWPSYLNRLVVVKAFTVCQITVMHLRLQVYAVVVPVIPTALQKKNGAHLANVLREILISVLAQIVCNVYRDIVMMALVLVDVAGVLNTVIVF